MINRDLLTNKYWRFFHKDGYVASEFFQFGEDGRIHGYSHENECYWVLSDGCLTILSDGREPTVIFDDVKYEDGLALLSGPHIPDPSITLCLKEQDGGRARHNVTKRALAHEIRDLGWSVGDHTYGVPHFEEVHTARFRVGKYCSIARGVTVALGDHLTSSGSTYPFATLRNFWRHVPHDIQDHATKGDVIIGSDVWVGTGVFIGSGVRIGDGAVIGAKSVVVKDVPPYAVVAGSPARLIRYRFSEAIIDQMLRLRWWDLDDETVDSLTPLLLSKDVDALLSRLEHIRISMRP